MANRLSQSTSPYLRQHQDNPVDWYEWGDEAFAAARLRDVPILLSVGYSACHWCHVMAHESFEDDEVAAQMNAQFVNVKVDREERPDVDRIYMDAVQAMTGRGGWPMTVFLTPDGRPFYAGTYFPKNDMHGHPAFQRVLAGVSQAWAKDRENVLEQADSLTEAISRTVQPGTEAPSFESLRSALESMAASFDWEYGGFGGAPKFPQAPNLEFLLRAASAGSEAHKFVELTLERMARGGIYDHVGGGFARYAVDRIWLVPHFEKMLYDNALLARTYLRASQVFGSDDLRRISIETMNYLVRDLRHPDGGFFSAEDADSEGVEGKFYVWSRDEVEDVLGEEAADVVSFYGVSDEGNFEGANILNEVHPWEKPVDRDALSAHQAALLERRAQRIRPSLDDKVVTAWNGLAIRAFAEAGAVLDSQRHLDVAVECAEFVLSNLRRADGRLMRSWREGTTSVPGFCDDYAAMAVALYTLYQATGTTRWFVEAERLMDEMIALFADSDEGGFFATATDTEALITRPKNVMDNPTPSENSLAAEALFMRLALTGDQDSRNRLEAIFTMAARYVEQYPSAVGHLLAVRHASIVGPLEVAVTGDDQDALADVVWERFRPHVVLARADEGSAVIPLLDGRTGSAASTAYVCRDFVCELPVHTAADLRNQLDASTDVGRSFVES
ncbi:MAG: thioredoxin domain-containing protein [Acidimicrobiia bacterium]|nr:thioredoxin domain-containing protein [Acidimicrobiia bacterium]